AVLAAFDFIAQLFKTQCQFRTVHGCHISLRNEDLVRLQSASLAVVPLRHIEDDGVSVQLRSRVSVHRPGSVVLECGCGKSSGCLWGMYVSDPRLRVSL